MRRVVALGQASMNYTTYFLMVVCSVLVLSIMLGLTRPFAMLPIADATNLPMQPTEHLEYTPPPASDFSIIHERPLFWRSRRPFIGPSRNVEPKSIEPLQGTLVGVFITDERRRALLRLGSNEDEYKDEHDGTDAIMTHEGQEIEGWNIETIENDRLVLRQGDVIQVIKLHRSMRGQTEIAPRPANDFYDLSTFLPSRFNEHTPKQLDAPRNNGTGDAL